MTNLLDALKAATAGVQSEPKQPETRRSATQGDACQSKNQEPETKGKPKLKTTTKAQAKAPETSNLKPETKVKGGAKYVIPKEFKQAIEGHLKGRPDMAEKLKQTGKSIDGCCDYIFDVMRKRAEKERNGKSAVGMYATPDEIFGLAAHYYDESDEDLKKER